MQTMIFFSSHCIRRGIDDIGIRNHKRTSRAHHRGRFDFEEGSMNQTLNQGSARIYQFPAGGRAALGGRSYRETKPIDNTPRVHEAAISSGSWYHEEAIREEMMASPVPTKPTWER